MFPVLHTEALYPGGVPKSLVTLLVPVRRDLGMMATCGMEARSSLVKENDTVLNGIRMVCDSVSTTSTFMERGGKVKMNFSVSEGCKIYSKHNFFFAFVRKFQSMFTCMVE